MNILLALVPAIGWGVQPLILKKVGGGTNNEILGTGIGAIIVGILVEIFTHPSVSLGVFLLSLLSGGFWVLGQIGQYISYDRMSVSRTMPISTGFQLIGTSLIGVLIFGEWSSSIAKIVGFIALAILLVGVLLTAVTDKDSDNNGVDISSIALLLFTSIGYWVYSAIPKAVTASGTAIFFPQMLGVFLGAVIYLIATKKISLSFNQVESWKDVSVGIIFAVSALAYIFSAKLNGVATAYIISQFAVVISTLGGLLILREKKSRRELLFTIIRLVLIVAGSIMTATL
ncbi:GRP family sugar transporter [Lactobacillus terrae]|uniref:GRP family sugar transporter n=1 Tax=Lactobacillus terrae TaxID=2269374 RepID=UPI000C1B79AD|nr:GRP family sugar transporter [Lactobacillus terrae]